MRDGAYLKRLAADLERWRTFGAVDPLEVGRSLAEP